MPTTGAGGSAQRPQRCDNKQEEIDLKPWRKPGLFLLSRAKWRPRYSYVDIAIVYNVRRATSTQCIKLVFGQDRAPT